MSQDRKAKLWISVGFLSGGLLTGQFAKFRRFPGKNLELRSMTGSETRSHTGRVAH